MIAVLSRRYDSAMRILLALSFLLICVFQSKAMQQREEQVEVERRDTLHYLLALPKAYDSDGEAVPLLLFLHGAGERGNDLDKVKLHGPPKMIDQGNDFGAIVVSPQCPADSWWPRETDLLMALIDKIEREYNVDKARIYVTGLSMGGYGTFALCARQPERFAAAVPICGGGDLFDARQLARLPMWVFHGEADNVVPVDESVRMVKVMNSSGGENAILTTYPGVGHNSWDRAYTDQSMWKWLFEQKRKK